MKKEDLEKYYFEHRHQRRYLGIFLMFAVIAVVIGIMAAFSIASMTGHGIFSFLKSTTTDTSISGGGGGGSGAPGNGTNGTLVTYEGVLNMLDRCFVALSSANMSMTCRQVCEMNNIGTCVAGFITDDNLTHQDRPVPCGYPIWRSSQRLICTCCSVL